MRRFAVLALGLLCFSCDGAGPDDGSGHGGDGKADAWGTDTARPIVLRGTVVTMDESLGDAQVIEKGAVVIQGAKVKAVLKPGQPLPGGAVYLPNKTGASDWVIVPGLINAHNHLAYNTARIYRDLPLYENTYQWRDEDYYGEHIQYPKRLLGQSSADVDELGVQPDGGERRVKFSGLVGRYSEVKELVSGTTTTQGSYFGTEIPAGYGQHLVRNLDGPNFGAKRVSQSSLGILVDNFDPRPIVTRMKNGQLDAFFVHLLEGTDQESRDELECLEAMGLVTRQLAIIHGTALTPEQLGRMAAVGAKLVSSPLDNLMYYGQGADIKTAAELGVSVSIGSDWSSVGSKNLLAELKVLELLNQQVWGGYFSERDMLEMVTTNPADAIGWTEKVGRIRPGLYADLAVYTRKPGGAYRAVLDATEADVRLVLVGGDPLYGDVSAMKKLKPGDYETLDGCGFTKAVDVTSKADAVEHGDVTFAALTAALAEALQFDHDWILAHLDPARTGQWTRDKLESTLAYQYPLGLGARDLDPLYVCQDPDFLDEVRTDPNVRTAYQGVCLDLRPWYGPKAAPDCGEMPARPELLTVDQHPGNIPPRAPAWCAMQTWTGTGPLPAP